MPDKSNMLKNLHQVQESLHTQVFNRGMNESSAVMFPHISFGGLRKGEGEALLVSSFAEASIKSMKVTTRAFSGGQSSMNRKPSASAAEFASDIAGFKRGSGAADMIVAWDKEMFQGMVRKGMSSWKRVSALMPVVEARTFLNHYFPDVSSSTHTSQQGVEDFVSKGIAAGNVKPGSSLDYLARARQMMVDAGQKALGDALPASQVPAAFIGEQISELVFTAAQLKAHETGTMKSFKQLLANQGVSGLSETYTGVFSFVDEHAIGSAIKSKTKSWAMYASSDAIGAPYEAAASFDSLFKRIEGIAGKRYRGVFQGIIEELHQRSGGSIAVAMDELGGVYIGAHGGDFNTFRPLPIGNVESGIGVSQHGMPSGVYKMGGKLKSARGVRMPSIGNSVSTVESPVILALEAFKAGALRHAGLTSENVSGAIHSGFKYMRKTSLIDVGEEAGAFKLSALSESVSTQGRTALYGALYDQYTVRSYQNELSAAKSALDEVFKQTRLNKIHTQKSFEEGVRMSLQNMPAELREEASAHAINMARNAWPAIKQELAVGNVLPMEALAEMFYPNELLSKISQTKGRHAGRGIQERVMSPGQFNAIKALHQKYGLHGRIRSVGSTRGEHAIQQALSAAYGSDSMMAHTLGFKAGGEVVTQGIAITTILPGGKVRFGDAGILMTELGQNAFARGSSVTKQIEMFADVNETVAMLEDIAGKHVEHSGWQDLIAKVRNQGVRPGRIELGHGLPIDKGVRDKYGLTAGTTHFTGVSLSDWDEKKVFTFSRQKPKKFTAGLVGGSVRATAAVGSKAEFARNTYGDLASFSHFITGADTVGSLDPLRRTFQHRTGILATLPGGVEANAPKFLELYEKFGGKGVSFEDNTLILEPGANVKNFLKASSKALGADGLGVDRGVVRGSMEDIARHMGRSSYMGTLSADERKYGRTMFLNWAQRAKEESDILAGEHPLSTRIKTLNQIAQSAGQNSPQYQFLKATLEGATGLEVSSTDLSPGGFINKKSIPNAIKNPFAPLVHNEGFNEWAANKKLKVMTAADASRQYGSNIGMRAIKNGMAYNELMSLDLLDPERPGFFIDLGDAKFNQKFGQYKEATISHSYIPSGEDLRRGIKGTGNRPVALGKESVERATFNLLSSLQSGKVDKIREKASALLTAQSRLGGRDGLLNKQLTGYGEVAATGRMVPQFKDSGKLTGKITKAEFNVDMSLDTMREMFKGDKEGFEAAIEKMGGMDAIKAGKGKRMAGLLMPTPTHGFGHLNIVKFGIDNSLSGDSVGFRVSDYVANTMWRDFDKDTIQAALFAGKRNMSAMVKKYGSMQAFEAAIEEEMSKQLLRHQRMYESYSHAAQQWSGLFSAQDPADWATKKGGEEALKRATSLLSFGSAPPIPWIAWEGEYALMSKLASSMDSARVADALMKENTSKVGKIITESIVDGMRNMLAMPGMSADKVWAESYNMFHTVAQSAIQKGGAFLDSLTETIDSREDARKLFASGQLDQAGVIEHQTQAYKKFFSKIAGDGEDLGKLALYSDNYVGLSKEEVIERAAGYVGRTSATNIVYRHQHLNDGADFGNSMWKSLSGEYDDGVSALEFLFGPDVKNGLKTSSQDAIAAANNAIQAAEEPAMKSLGAGMEFLNKHWKGALAIGGVLMGGRALYGALGGGEMSGPPVRMARQMPAPLPPEPMVGRNQSGPNISSAPYEARFSRPNGHLSMQSYSRRANAVNINEFTPPMNPGSMGTSISRVNVRDSRKYTSQWSMQDAFAQSQRSDFIHEYQ